MNTYAVLNRAINPELDEISLGKTFIRWSLHSIERWESKIGASLPRPEEMTFAKGSLVEAYFRGPKLEKVLVRIEFSSKQDLCLIIAADTKTVITCYLNNKNDQHATLKLGRAG